jgi:hypothetical protein
VLRKDGTIEMSYQQLAAKDAIVGVYPMVNAGAERALATLPAPRNPRSPRTSMSATEAPVVDGLFLKVTFETRGIVPEGDSGLAGTRTTFDSMLGRSLVWTTSRYRPGARRTWRRAPHIASPRLPA